MVSPQHELKVVLNNLGINEVQLQEFMKRFENEIQEAIFEELKAL